MLAKITAFFAGAWVKLAEVGVIVSAILAAVIFVRQSGKQAERLKNYETATAKFNENLAIRRDVGTDKQLLDSLREGKF